LYVAANVIPDFAVLVPASILQGCGAALMWNAVSTYVTYLARSTAIWNVPSYRIIQTISGLVIQFIVIVDVDGDCIV
jgi:hypothetical protein